VAGPADLYLRIEASPGEEPRLVPVADGLTFGRATENRCQIREEDVSRFHAKIVREGDGWALLEVRAKNPVKVRRRGEEYLLRDRGICFLEPGLEFTIGSRWCAVFEKEAAAPPEPSTAAEGTTEPPAGSPAWYGKKLPGKGR
jgi:hypothetical protein